MVNDSFVLTTFIAQCAKEGLTAEHDLDQAKITIRNGRQVVEWWPWSKRKTLFVQRTRKGIRCTDPAVVIRTALEGPKQAKQRVKRTKQTSSKIALFNTLKDTTNTAPCYWCKSRFKAGDLTIDHVVALSRGGADKDYNRVLSCEPCNQRKGNSNVLHTLPKTENQPC